MEEFYIKTEEYSRLLREKKLKGIGI